MTDIDHTTIDADTLAPLTHTEGMRLFGAELQRNLDLIRGFSDKDWAAPTECPAWDVRQLYLHVLGACESGASLRELVHQMWAARSYQRVNGGPQEAALSAVQVADRNRLTPRELVARFSVAAPAAVRGRTRLPAIVRRAHLKVDGPVAETWTLGYLVDTIYLRDAWMHRIDASRAVGAPLVLTQDHDGRIVADVVGEWARRHGQQFTLTLTGPAGGRFTGHGGSGAGSTMDAVEFCRTLAGRESAAGLLATVVPF